MTEAGDASASKRDRRFLASRTAWAAAVLICALAFAALSASGDFTSNASALAALGKQIFFDASLSASGKMSCASCHDPRHAYGPPDGRAVRRGAGPDALTGVRAVPSLRYVLNRTPRWSKQYQSNPLERVIETDSAPTGGFAWDGRFDSPHEQAATPFLAANEMGNASAAAVGEKLSRAAYADAFRSVFGAEVFTDREGAFREALLALERFELDDPSFHPYSSRYDAYLDGKVKLNDAELRGLRLFMAPDKGNCGACHRATPGADGSHPLFTDFSFAALGVPRNPEIPANTAKDYFDLGLCGPLRGDQAAQRNWCGLFKTPTLRNAAARRVFFHNGKFHTLREALRFYAERDVLPARWYPRRGSVIELYDDLPPALRGNVDHLDAPLNRGPADPPALNSTEIDDLAAFIATLTDADVAQP